jgi:hypothetical protein
MALTSNPNEQISAATSVLLALLAFGVAAYLYRLQRSHNRLKASFWLAGVCLLGVSGMIGSLNYTIRPPESIFINSLGKTFDLWRFLAAAMFLCGVAYDLHGPAFARRALPYTAGAGLVFYLAAIQLPISTSLIALYETLAMLPAFIFYSWLATRFQFEGAGWMSAGAMLYILAGWLQTNQYLQLDMLWTFNSYGAATMVRLGSLLALALGLRRFLLPYRPSHDAKYKQVISRSEPDL